MIRQCNHVCHMCNSAYVLCVCVYMCVCVCMCVYASVVFKNGKGSFTQCILVHMHVNPESWHILCELTIVCAKRKRCHSKWYSLVGKA